MATRFAYANETEDDGLLNIDGDGDNHDKGRRATKLYTATMPHHGFNFKAFTRESLIDIQKRKLSSKAKRSSAAHLDPITRQKLEPDPYLASGQQLPRAVVRQMPAELIGKPIEDIDPYYADQETFVIISRGKELTRFSATKALYLFGPFHPIRRVVLYILVNPIFNLLVILTILINCILMTIQGSETVERTEIIFTIVYTTEMGLKVLARGFIIDEFTYLRDPWNWLDFAVIIMAYLTIVVQDLGNLSVMRTFRVLRALKTVAIIPGMKTIVGAVIDSVKNLKDVVVLTLFSLSVFSLLGLQIYMGILTQKCILNGPVNMSNDEWHMWNGNASNWIPEQDDEIFGAYRLCGNATGAQSCPGSHTCLQGFGPNPDYGFTNFDTFGWALICSFRLMTQDFWEGLYMQVLKTAGSWHIIFFIVSIFLGSIYLMNLILAIVAMSYNELQRRAEEEEEAAAEDEAAFLEQCRLMELQDQLTDYSGSIRSAASSYRPSVEIGLVGQSMLANLCQNGLLGQHVREKLNQQIILPSFGASNLRSQSFSVDAFNTNNSNIDSRLAQNSPFGVGIGVAIGAEGGGGGGGGSGGEGGSSRKRSSTAAYRGDPFMTASSMTELRRKSSIRTNGSSGGSPTNNNYPITVQPKKSICALTTNNSSLDQTYQTMHNNNNHHHRNHHHHHHHGSLSGGTGEQAGDYQRSNKLSPHYISSSVIPSSSARHHHHHHHQQHHQQQQQQQQQRESTSLFVNRRSTRSSVVSVGDLNQLRQRAALIRIVSDDYSTPPKHEGAQLQRDQTIGQSSMDLPVSDASLSVYSTRRALDRSSIGSSIGACEGEVEGGAGITSLSGGHYHHGAMLSPETSLECSEIQQHSLDDADDADDDDGDGDGIMKHRTKSQDYTVTQSAITPKEHETRLGALEQLPSRYHSEAQISPKQLARARNSRRAFQDRRSLVSMGSNRSDSQDQSSLTVRTVAPDLLSTNRASLQPTTSASATTTTTTRREYPGATRSSMSSSARVLNIGQPASALSALSAAAATTKTGRIHTRDSASFGYVNQLGIEQTSSAHHLSVENFHQFWSNKPPQPSAGTSIRSSPHQSASGGGARLPGVDSSSNIALSRESTFESEPQLRVAQSAIVRGRLESQGYIHPSTMVRSSFSRPRPSFGANNAAAVSAGGRPGPAGARRVSQDFVRRASNWSRLSMSGNVDMRRLLKLWSHTNPYQGGGGGGGAGARPSIGSFQSNFSHLHQSMIGSSIPSIKHAGIDLVGYDYAQNNLSPRPSSVGSARQAYELISAMSRRRSRFQNDGIRYSMALDNMDNMDDKISVTMRDKCLACCLSCLDVLCIWECCGSWLRIQKLIALIVFDPFTELFIILCILINTLFMALDSDDADIHMRRLFERGNYFFTATFAVEASMKIMALSPKFYFREGWNVFDSIIVGLSLLELGLEGVYGLSVLRSFRLLRVFKLAKSWPTLNLLISIMGKAVGDLGNLTFVLAIIVFIFAVMGMQLFGNKYVDHNFPSGQLPRWNFTDFMHSFMIVFRILCAEWIEPMWDCLLVGGWPCIPFFLIAVTVGNLVVLNLFLALLLASFGASNLSSPQADNVDTKKLQEAIGRFSRFSKWVRTKLGNLIQHILTCGRRNKDAGSISAGSNKNYTGADGSSGHPGDVGRPLKSHIVAMSKLERLKNIEMRTEELKSRIRRSPEHQYHLRQLAKMQLKQSNHPVSTTTKQQTASSSSLGATATGYNYNYNQLRFHRTSGGKTKDHMPVIPIIVDEAVEAEENSDDSRQLRNDDSIQHNHDHNYTEHNHDYHHHHHHHQSEEDFHQREVDLKSPPTPSSSLIGITNNSNQQTSIKPQIRHPSYCTSMQPIREDSRDAESTTSEQSLQSISINKSLDRLARDEVSSRTHQVAGELLASHNNQMITTTTIAATATADDDDGSIEMLDLEDNLLDPIGHQVEIVHSARSRNHLTSPGMIVGVASGQGEGKDGGEGAGGEEERPKSSLYLKAPERQDMEEEDEKTLQHIEKYIENCIWIGIICLKWFLFRQHVRKVVEHKYFDQCILVLIVISSSTLALEDKHLNERPTLKWTLDILDTIFTIIFSLEMIMKWLAFGIKRYFGNIWSWLDFIIVLVSFVNLMASIFGSGKIQALKTMRTLRAMRGLRPLRALQRFQGMRVVVNALIQAIPSIFNVLLVCLIFWLIFSIMGVQMFGGKFWRCLDPQTKELVDYEIAENKQECISKNLTWSNPQINFDNVLNAYLALFQVATFKGWIDIMNSATDSRNRDDQPIREANIYMYFYFVFFVIFGSFFTLNLFIGVIIDNFNEQKKKTGGSLEIFMTDDQKKYYHAMKKMRSKRPTKAMTRPRMKLQAIMFDITTSKKFDLAIMIIIGLNMFVMALEHYGQSQEFSLVLENLNLIFIAIFTLECLCKVFAMRHFYFREPWNIFDFIVVNLSILGVVMKEYVAKYFVSPTLLRVVRVVKVGRVLRLVKGAKGIRTLLFALAMSLPALFNICLLLFMVMFIYAIFGMSFFMNVRRRAGVDETFNFDTFTSSIVVLFQMSTSAGWDLVLDPLMDEENDCQKPDPILGIEGTCGNRAIAIFYLISYVIVTFLIIINMYIAVILENYSQATEDVQEGLTDDDYEMYYEIWQKFDPNGTQYLPYEKLSDFVDSLEDPLRIPKPNQLALVILDITIYKGNRCYCVDILDALTKFFFTRKGLIISVNEHLQKVQSTLHETPFETLTTTYMLKREQYCARLIQNCWRKWRAQKGLQHLADDTKKAQ